MKKSPAPAAFVLPAAIAAAFAATLVLGAAPRAAAQPPAPAPARPACFWTRSIRNFAANDTNSVYLRVGGNQVFQLSLFANCINVNWVHRMGLRTRGGGNSNICEGPNPGLDVVIHDVGVAGNGRCPVTGVRRLTPEEVAALPPQARP